MKPTNSILALSVAILALPFTALAENTASDEQPIDDIVVVGKKSLGDLRRDVFEAEEDFYALFNQLNDEPDYNVRCFYEKATGTNIKNHVCRARFVSKAYSSHAARNGGDLSRVANQDVNPQFAAKTEQYQEKMETLVAENPNLMEALVRYNTVRAQFMAVREEKANN